MTRFCIICLAALGAIYCSPDVFENTVTQGFGSNPQGRELQGTQLAGAQLDGMVMQGFRFADATRNGSALGNVRIERGEIVAEQGQTTLRGTDLIGAHFLAQVRNIRVTPTATAVLEYRVTGVEAEGSNYDPTMTGSTYLYTLEQVDGSGTWQTACPADLDGRHAAIPVAAIWDEHGDRIESTTLFTFGCTTGVIAKCYRWGFRPWLTGYGDVVGTHWACTRAARADYCGDGTPHTHEGTLINIWDNLPSPGPIQPQGTTPFGMVFEAGWNTSGVVCLSHARWLLGGPLIALGCPGRLIAPGLGILNATVCDTTAQVLGSNPGARVFNESYLNLNLDLF